MVAGEAGLWHLDTHQNTQSVLSKVKKPYLRKKGKCDMSTPSLDRYKTNQAGVLVYAYNPSTRETEEREL